MTRYRTIGQLFDEEPMQFGLRGDPYLWRVLRDHFAATPLPAYVSELEQMIGQAFEQLTGHPLSTPTHFFLAEFAHGGISSGGISPEFWRESVLPLLRSRYAAR